MEITSNEKLDLTDFPDIYSKRLKSFIKQLWAKEWENWAKIDILIKEIREHYKNLYDGNYDDCPLGHQSDLKK